MQADPFKPTLKPPGTERLKLKCDTQLSTFAFKFNLRRYSEDPPAFRAAQARREKEALALPAPGDEDNDETEMLEDMAGRGKGKRRRKALPSSATRAAHQAALPAPPLSAANTSAAIAAAFKAAAAPAPGRAVQVDPIKPTLRAPGSERLKQ